MPPPSASQRNGPRTETRSYADAVRGPDLDEDGHEIRRLPADRDLGLLIRELYGFIKAVHHLHNVSPNNGGSAPRTISRMVDTLSTMIKPAAPTPTTRLLIEGAAREWGHSVCMILRQHYEDCIDGLLGGLSGLLTETWREAFRVATRWARRNLPRLTGDTIAAAEARLSARAEEMNDPTPPLVPVFLPPRSLVSPVTVTPSIRTSPPETVPLIRQPEPRLSPGPRSQTTGSTRAGLEIPPSEVESDDWRFTPPASTRRQEVENPPLERRGPKGTRGGSLLDRGTAAADHRHWDIALQLTWGDIPPPPFPLPGGITSRPQFGELGDELGFSGATSTSQDPTEYEAQIDSDEGDASDDEGSVFSQAYQVTTHPRMKVKSRWTMNVKCKWLIMGDSTLSSLPDHDIPDLQMDSFPGAHFRHMQELLKDRTTTMEGLVVEKLILSFGINSRANAKETTIKSTQGALRAARERFPAADIRIQQVNFMKTLPPAEQDNLRIFNEHLERNMPYIPLLPESQFRTVADQIHWTAETGKAFFDHWLVSLTPDPPDSDTGGGRAWVF